MMIGLLEIRRRKVQFALIALVVTLISYLVLMINGLGVGLNDAAGSALRSFDADGIAYNDRAGLSLIRSELSTARVDEIASTPGAEESAALGYVAANYSTEAGDVDSAAFIGIDPGTIAEPPVTGGRQLEEADSRGVLADKSFLQAAGLQVGDTIGISVRLDSLDFEIVGEVDEGNFFFQPTVYLLRSSWQELKYGPDEESVPAASVVLLQGGEELYGGFDGYEVVTKDTAFANIEGVQGQQGTVVALRVFGYVIGALVIGVFFYVLTLQKVSQIGVMKALGASSFFVFRQGLVQALAISVIGVAISVPVAWLTEAGLSAISNDIPISFRPDTYVTTSIFLLVAATVGALFSVRQVARVDPIIALGQQQ